MKINFDNLESLLQSRTLNYLTQWLPGGKLVGHEYACGSIRGEAGSSFKYNVNTGKWKDFADDSYYGVGLISLYAKINGVGYADAAFKLNDELGMAPTIPVHTKKVVSNLSNLTPAPITAPRPTMVHSVFGKPSAVYEYKNESSETLFFMARYNHPTGKKDFIPWSYTNDGRWIPKAYPNDRVLYNLHLLNTFKDKTVLLVEGEKCADVANQLLGDHYVSVTWSSGAQAYRKTDFKPLHGRKILLWPDNDEPGIKAMNDIMRSLIPHTNDIKIIQPSDVPDGWDIADAMSDGMNRDGIISWAKSRVKVIKPVNKNELIETLNKRSGVLMDPESKPITVEVDDGETITEDIQKLILTLGLDIEGAQGKPICNMSNVLRVLKFMPKYRGVFWFDEFKMRHMYMDRPLEDNDDLPLLTDFQRFYGFYKLSRTILLDAIMLNSFENKRNPLIEKLNSYKWDGTPRVDRFFVDRYGVEESEYSLSVSASFFISLIARIYKPGCKVDTMIVLEGEAGTGKTSFAEYLLGEEYFTSAHKDPSHKDFKEGLVGYAIVEFSELAQLSKVEKEIIKAEITTRIDKFRRSYGRFVSEHKRTCVFIGTTNRDDYLNDETGNRRFLPLTVNRPDDVPLEKFYDGNIEYIKTTRDQLLAEAIHRYRQGESWWKLPVEETLYEQSTRKESDPWESKMFEYIEHRNMFGQKSFKVDEFYGQECLDIVAEKRSILFSRRIGKILRQNGFLSKITTLTNNDLSKTKMRRSVQVFVKKEDYDDTVCQTPSATEHNKKYLKNYAILD